MNLQSFLRADGILFFCQNRQGQKDLPSVKCWKWARVSLCEAGVSMRFYCKLLYFALQWEDSICCYFITTPPRRSLSRAVCLEIKSVSGFSFWAFQNLMQSMTKPVVLCVIWNETTENAIRMLHQECQRKCRRGEKFCPMVILMTEKLLNKYWLLLKKRRLPIVFKMDIYNHFCKWDFKW